MADYAKKKNDELAALCKERNLPHTGKKADLVKRLEEYDTKNIAAPAVAANEDEIDWDEEPASETAKTATTEPAANAIAAGGIGAVGNPQAVPNQVAAIDPAQTDDLSVAAAPAVTEEKVEEKNFSTGIAERTFDEEFEKRKARLIKFGVTEDSEEMKALVRAKKFGSDLAGLGGLNTALSAEKGGRKRDGESSDGGIRKRGRGGRNARGGRRQGGGEREGPRKAEDGYPGWMTAADREAANKRKAKFSS